MNTTHTITIVIHPNGRVQGDLDDEVSLFPIGTESTAESTTIDGQARSILDQALMRILTSELSSRRGSGRGGE